MRPLKILLIARAQLLCWCRGVSWESGPVVAGWGQYIYIYLRGVTVCSRFWGGIGRGNPGVFFISTSIRCSSVSRGHLHCFTTRQHVPVTLPATILASTISRLETGVQHVKSDIHDTDVFGLNPWNFMQTLVKTARVRIWAQLNSMKASDVFVSFTDSKHFFQERPSSLDHYCITFNILY